MALAPALLPLLGVCVWALLPEKNAANSGAAPPGDQRQTILTNFCFLLCSPAQSDLIWFTRPLRARGQAWNPPSQLTDKTRTQNTVSDCQALLPTHLYAVVWWVRQLGASKASLALLGGRESGHRNMSRSGA